MGFAGGWTSTVGDDVVAVFEVRGEHAVVPGEMGAWAWHEGGELTSWRSRVNRGESVAGHRTAEEAKTLNVVFRPLPQTTRVGTPKPCWG